MPESIAYNCDCIEYMRTLPDNAFDLAVVDPPYGAGFTEGGGCKGRFAKYHQDSSQSLNVEREREREAPQYNRFGSPGSRFEKYKRDPDGRDVGGEVRKKIIAWDVAPGQEYFDELFRVSRNQIIWGGNYFPLPPTRCFLVWRKLTISESFTMAMAEYAWTSFNSNAKVFDFPPQGKKGDTRFHPCLPPDELVYMNGRWKPIKDVRVGEKNEFGEVAAITTHEAERLVEIEACDYKTIATWNHPFLVLRGTVVFWMNAEHIKEGDQILCLHSTPRQGKGICATGQTPLGGSEWSTTLCGKNTMGQSQMECKSTTETSIKPTMILPTYNLLRPLNTNGFTRVATLKTNYGTNDALVAESTNPLQKKIGTSIKERGGLLRRIANRAMSKKLSKAVECELLTVGNVKTIKRKTPVINLTIKGIPAFETSIGISHNTQKPIELYSWVFNLFAKPGDKILDTHLGSGSSRIAAYDAGLDFVGCEIDPVYFKAEEERFEKHIQQHSIFDADYSTAEQTGLWEDI